MTTRTSSAAAPAGAKAAAAPKPFYSSFGFQVLAAMVIGLVLGLVARDLGPDAAGNPNWLQSNRQQSQTQWGFPQHFHRVFPIISVGITLAFLPADVPCRGGGAILNL